MTFPIDQNKVVVAMSGGVDSSVAAALLLEQGYEVIGISMKTHDDPPADALPVVTTASKSCCSVEDIQDARGVCRQLGIPFYAMNFKQAFKESVMDYFADEYAAGRTPNPCIPCNSHLKFTALLEKARGLGAAYLATGHYVRKEANDQGQWRVLQGYDRQKDQSYFLFGLTQEQLQHILFPVGHMTKAQVRDEARRFGIRTAEKAESQEICFVPDNDYAAVIEKRYPEKRGKAGRFRLRNGTVLGSHRGTHAYTIGQRRGLGVAAGKRLYVTRIDTESGDVTLGEDEELFRSSLAARNLNWIGGTPGENEFQVTAKIRYRHAASPAHVRLLPSGRARIDFQSPQRAIAPGQAVVFYRQDELLGGGWIEAL